ncbi:MAG: metalloregulator ArsR/SmtB family transcription factor [Burkholderiaceae bacterium]|jgi:DNA-binding transcriptional ArsR family regulator
MVVSPGIATIASLIGDPTRSMMLFALMDGRALSVSELAEAAGVTVQTASAHLSKLEAAMLLAVERQGRHRYFRVAGPEVAQVLEGLMGLAARSAPKRVEVGPAQSALRHARLCYDHLAGERGVALLDAMKAQELIVGEGDLILSDSGVGFLEEFGIPVVKLKGGRRPVCRGCLDWSERRQHLGGSLGAALLSRMLEMRWISRTSDRTLQFTSVGDAGFARWFPLESRRLNHDPG